MKNTPSRNSPSGLWFVSAGFLGVAWCAYGSKGEFDFLAIVIALLTGSLACPLLPLPFRPRLWLIGGGFSISIVLWFLAIAQNIAAILGKV